MDFCNRMRTMLGEEYPAFLASYDRPPARGLRVNRRYISDETLWRALSCAHAPIPYQDGGYYCDEKVGAHPLHHAGAYYVQEPSAMLTANALDVPVGAHVLDMCAAPGGKTTQLAAMVGPTGWVVANEIDLGRAKTLMGNVERLGLANVVVTSLAPTRVAAEYGAVFDIVVVDAPCSGEGMFRKNPSAVDEWSSDNVAMCAARGRDILLRAAACVREGGHLVYSTCTFAPEENEGGVRFLLDTGDFAPVMPTARVLAATVAGEMPFCRRFYPHSGLGEGHFVAVLRRISPTDVPPKCVPHAAPPPAAWRTIRAHLRGTLGTVPAGDCVWVNRQACLVAPDMPLPRYGCLSAGVKLGEAINDRLDPHHMLFKCLPTAARLDLAVDDPRVARYLHGETLDADLANGWCTVMVEGCPLGGGKVVNGVLKNHYPKGLRTP